MPNPVYIYDAVRTPRSKGKSTGTLHEVKPIDLAAGLLVELQKRHDLDTSYVDDVVMGCVSPVGEQGSDVAKMVVQNADWDESVMSTPTWFWELEKISKGGATVKE